jgi:ATP-dependent Lon protease
MSPVKSDNKPKAKYNLRNQKNEQLKKNKPHSDSESDEETDSDYEDDEEDIEDTESEYETMDEDETEETTDSSYRPKSKKNRRAHHSDDEEDEDDDDFIVDDDEEEGKFSPKELRKELARLFPSKYMSEKVKKDEKMQNKKKSKKQKEENDSEEEEEEEEEEVKPKKSTKKNVKSKKTNEKEKDKKKEKKPPSKKETKKSDKKNKKNKNQSESESSFSEEEYDQDDDSEYDDDDDEDGSPSKQKLNIFFTIGADEDEEYFDDSEEEDTAVAYQEDDECNSDDEQTFMKENYQEVKLPEESESRQDTDDTEKKTGDKNNGEKNNKKNAKKNEKNNNKKEKKGENEKDKKKKGETEEDLSDIETEYLELLELKKDLTAKLAKKPNSKILIKAIQECKDSIKKLIKSARSKNTKTYHKLIYGTDQKKTNEMDYFKKKLSNKEQLKIVNDLKEINSFIHVDKPYRLSILQSKMPTKFKAIAMQKLDTLKSMEPCDSEYHKIKNWVDTFMKIPFGVYKNLSISMNDGLEVCNDFMQNAKKTLDECVYGLDDAKMQIMQMLGQWLANPTALGTAIAIKGPPGTGKTTLVKDGISKILGREFTFIALGGTGDSSFLEGHSYTYEGSTWGKIVQILIESKCMNPVIYFDELDKISDTARGQEIVGILTHLTDTSQNSQFHDKYFSEIDFDLSKCLFIFSYNDESLVNPILKDRMYRIQTAGYDSKEKTVIAKNYLLPKIREQVNFNDKDIIIPDETIQYIIGKQGFTKGEDGVRNLKRCLEIIHTKLNLFRLVKPENNLFAKQLDIKVSFPMTVTKQIVDQLIKNEENLNQSLLAMYV